MSVERWKRGLTVAYIAAWAFWAVAGLLGVIHYPGSTDGPRYPRVVAGTVVACVVMPAFLLGILRQAFDRFVKAPQPDRPDQAT